MTEPKPTYSTNGRFPGGIMRTPAEILQTIIDDLVRREHWLSVNELEKIRGHIAELERQNALMLAVAQRVSQLQRYEKRTQEVTHEYCYLEPFSEWQDIHDEMFESLQAAVDGGALQP